MSRRVGQGSTYHDDTDRSMRIEAPRTTLSPTARRWETASSTSRRSGRWSPTPGTGATSGWKSSSPSTGCTATDWRRKLACGCRRRNSFECARTISPESRATLAWALAGWSGDGNDTQQMADSRRTTDPSGKPFDSAVVGLSAVRGAGTVILENVEAADLDDDYASQEPPVDPAVQGGQSPLRCVR